MTLSSANIARPYRIGRIRHLPAKTTGGSLSAVFIKGDIVTLDATSKEIDRGGTHPTSIVGIAAADANNTTPIANQDRNSLGQILRPVWVADLDHEFVFHVADGQTPVAADVNLTRDLVRDTTRHIWRVDRTSGANARVRIVQVLDPGRLHGRVVVRFLAANLAPFVS